MLSEQLKDFEQTLWQTVDTLRANSDLKSTEYSTPVLGLIFLQFDYVLANPPFNVSVVAKNIAAITGEK